MRKEMTILLLMIGALAVMAFLTVSGSLAGYSGRRRRS
jgi:hypothetical protein